MMFAEGVHELAPVWLDTRNICSERLCDMELQQGLRGYRTAAVVSCIGQRSIVKSPICGSKIRQNLANANYSNLPLLWPPAVKDAQRRNGINGGDPRSGEEAVYGAPSEA